MMIHKNKRASGFTLLEILIALLIVSIGLLGVATLLIRGQQFTQVAYFRTQATFLAYDLMDRIRVNFATMTAIHNANYDTNGFVNKGLNSSEPDSFCDTNACSSTELQDYDLTNWLYLLKESLPSGKAKIVADGTNSDGIVAQYTITICWKDVIDNQKTILNTECQGEGEDNIRFELQKWTLQL